MKWFKKITSVFLILLLSLNTAIPAFAYTDSTQTTPGYLQGLTPTGSGISNGSNFTENGSVGGTIGSYGYADFTLSSAQTINKIYYSGVISSSVSIILFDSSGANLRSVSTTNFSSGGSYYSVSVSGVKKIEISNQLGNSINITEIDAYGPDLTPPANPTNLAVTSITTNSANVSWTKASDPDYASSRVYLNGSLYYTATGATVSKAITGLSAGTVYSIKITSVDTNNNESTGSTTSFTTSGMPNVTGLTVKNITDTKADISFTPTSDTSITSYRIYLNGSLKTTLDKSLSTYSFTSLTASTNYTVKVTTYNGISESTGTTTTFKTAAPPDLTPPGEVSSVIGVGDSETSIKLQWTPPGDSDLKQVNIWRDGVYITSIPKGTNTFIDTGLSTQPGGKPYQYKLVTEDNAGNKSTGITTTVKTADKTPPDEVSNAQANVLSDTAVQLNWTNPTGPNNTDFTDVQIFVAGQVVYHSQTTDTSWIHVGLNPNTVYTWVLRTEDTSGNLSPGVSVTAKTFGPSDPPGNLNGTPGDGKTSLQWAAPSGTIQGYNIYQDGVKITSSPITETNYSVTGLKNGQTYKFEVSAVNAYGESPLSQPIDVKPFSLGKITGLKAAEKTKTYVKFVWNKETNAERYHIDITIKHRQTAAAGISDSFAAGDTSTTTFGIETSSNDVTVTGLTGGDTVTASVSGYTSANGLYGTATTSTDVPTVDVPQLTATPSITAGDLFQSGVSLASNFWLFLVLGLSFVLVPWIYSLLRRSTTAAKPNTVETESTRGTSRGLNREIRHSLREGNKP